MNNKGPEKGAALIIALMVMVVAAILGIAVSLSAINESRLAQRRLYSTQAFWLAEAGIQAAYRDVYNNDCHGLKDHATQVSCASCSACSATNDLTGSLATGDYNVTVSASNTRFQSTGYYPDRNSPKVQRAVQTDLSTSPLFTFAAFARNSMVFDNNAMVDSYNSNNGAYGGANVNSNGNIGTNSTNVGAITLSNNVEIKGTASTGAGGTVVVGSGASVSGGVTHNNNITLVPVVVPDALKTASCDTVDPVMSIGGHNTKTLGAGDYKCTKISMGEDAELIINGDVRIYLTNNPSLVATNNDKVTINNGGSLKLYVDGSISFNNNVELNNVGEKPEDFMIFSTYTGVNGVEVKNNAAFYGAIYASETDIVMENNANVFGAMVGKTVLVSNNGEVHFDQALATVNDPNAIPTLRNWQEL